MEILFLTRTAGSYRSAGVPNITGTIHFNGMSSCGVYSGALYPSSNKIGAYLHSIEKADDPSMCFDASRSNSIYGSSDTVQPNSLTVRFYIKF